MYLCRSDKSAMYTNYPLIVLIISTSFSLRKFRSSHPGKAQHPQEQCYPFLEVCAVFSSCCCFFLCLYRQMYGYQCFLIFNVRTDVDACDCTRGLNGHRKRVSLKVDSGRKIPCRTGVIEPASVLHLAFQSDALLN